MRQARAIKSRQSKLKIDKKLVKCLLRTIEYIYDLLARQDRNEHPPNDGYGRASFSEVSQPLVMVGRLPHEVKVRQLYVSAFLDMLELSA